jgi:methyltransferase
VDLSQIAYLGLLTVAGAGRLAEMRLSRRNQQRMIAQGASRISEPHFPWMVVLHAGVMIGAGVEVIVLHRPLIPALAIPMVILFLLSNALRWWVIRSLRGHWNVQVVDSARLGVVTSGPYRWIRHPNYVAVFAELLSLPLIYTAWITALAGAVFDILILQKRLAVEDAVLFANPAYRVAMGGKPRFFPKLFQRLEIHPDKSS